MRVLFVQNMYSPYRDTFYEALAERVDVGVYYLRRDRPQKNWGEDPGGHSYETFDSSAWARIGPMEFDRGLDQVLIHFGPTHVVAAGWNLRAPWQVATSRREFVKVAWVESTEFTSSISGPAARAFRRAYLSRFDAVAVPGQSARRYVSRLAPRARTIEFPNSVGDPSLLPEGLVHPLRERTNDVIFIGELSHRKGFDLLLEAMGLPEMINTTLTICGDGPLRPLVQRDDRISMLGYVGSEERRRELCNAKLLCLPSRSDPWPLAAAEAWVAGTGLALGPGVGSRDDFVEADRHAVVGMSLDASSVAGSIQQLLRREPKERPAEARARLLPSQVAEAFVKSLETLR